MYIEKKTIHPSNTPIPKKIKDIQMTVNIEYFMLDP